MKYRTWSVVEDGARVVPLQSDVLELVCCRGRSIHAADVSVVSGHALLGLAPLTAHRAAQLGHTPVAHRDVQKPVRFGRTSHDCFSIHRYSRLKMLKTTTKFFKKKLAENIDAQISRPQEGGKVRRSRSLKCNALPELENLPEILKERLARNFHHIFQNSCQDSYQGSYKISKFPITWLRKLGKVFPFASLDPLQIFSK